jgi:hypothetical protein
MGGSQNLLFLESPTYNLQSNMVTIHRLDIVVAPIPSIVQVPGLVSVVQLVEILGSSACGE